MFGFGSGSGKSNDNGYGGPGEGVGGGPGGPGGSGQQGAGNRNAGATGVSGVGAAGRSVGGTSSGASRTGGAAGRAAGGVSGGGNVGGAASGGASAASSGSGNRNVGGFRGVGAQAGGFQGYSHDNSNTNRATVDSNGGSINNANAVADAARAAGRVGLGALGIGNVGGVGDLGGGAASVGPAGNVGLGGVKDLGTNPARTAADTAGLGLGAFKESLRTAIAGNETAYLGDLNKAYAVTGKVQDNGDYAIGRYQIMASNVPQWTRQVLGKSMTPEEFRTNPAAQDAVFDGTFGGMVHGYTKATGDLKKGVELAAREWYGGPKGMKNLAGHDNASGISVADYGKTVADKQAKEYASLLAGGGTTVAAMPAAPSYRHIGGAGSQNDVNFADTYLGAHTRGVTRADQGRGGVPAAKPGAGVAGNKPEGPQTGQEYPDRPRSTFEKVAAGAIDIGAGLVPGVGTYIGLGNAGLALTGNRTIGERIVDAIATGDNKAGATDSTSHDPYRYRTDKGGPDSRARPSAKKGDTVATTPDDFAITYLGDNTKRPTPTQRWIAGRDTYAG